MLGYLSADIICSEKRRVFRERSSRKTVSYEEQVMSKDKYPSIFSHQMATIVYIFPNFQNCPRCGKDLKNSKHNSHHLAWKYARILVLGYYLFLQTHSFPQATPSGTSEQKMSVDKCPSIFSRQMQTTVYLSNRPQVSVVYKLINHAGCW